MSKSQTELWVIMPVYNEAETLVDTVSEWLDCFRTIAVPFVMCLINDGSTDDSMEILRNIEAAQPEVVVLDKINSGHGQTCLTGFKAALSNNASYVFQIDSDGQCDPGYFSELWRRKDDVMAVFGNRAFRQDGLVRSTVSRFLSIVIFLFAGVYVPDANVPYRLINSKVLHDVLKYVPEDVDLANVFIATILQKQKYIIWVKIGFRKRRSGISNTNLMALGKKCLALVPQLIKLRSRLNQGIV